MMISCEIVSPSKVRTSQKKIANELGQSNPPPHYHSNRYLTTAETAQERYGKTRRREFVSCMKKTSPTLPAKFQCRPKGVFDRTSRWLLSPLDHTPELHHDPTTSNLTEEQEPSSFPFRRSRTRRNGSRLRFVGSIFVHLSILKTTIDRFRRVALLSVTSHSNSLRFPQKLFWTIDPNLSRRGR